MENDCIAQEKEERQKTHVECTILWAFVIWLKIKELYEYSWYKPFNSYIVFFKNKNNNYYLCIFLLN